MLCRLHTVCFSVACIVRNIAFVRNKFWEKQQLVSLQNQAIENSRYQFDSPARVASSCARSSNSDRRAISVERYFASKSAEHGATLTSFPGNI